MHKRILKSLADKEMVDDARPYSVHEDWDLKEKLAKFIVNSCNVYAWFGFEYRLPFYDVELMEFFRHVPFRFKENKILYDTYLEQSIFRDLNLIFSEEINPSEQLQRRYNLRMKIKRYIPRSLMPVRLAKSDSIYYREITQRLQNDMALKGRRIKAKGNSYNSLIIQWYTEYLKSKFPEH
jgi:asparagine synthase (glutamine-hydrolysing)